MDLSKRCKCANCHQRFRADARNAWHQRYCKEAACRAASKAASQRRWLDKPENHDYFCGPGQVARVRAWREEHPGYGRRAATSPLQPTEPRVTHYGFRQFSLKDPDGYELWFHWRVK